MHEMKYRQYQDHSFRSAIIIQFFYIYENAGYLFNIIWHVFPLDCCDDARQTINVIEKIKV